jgi:hypothetical protein
MKLSLVSGPGPPTRGEAITCALINQFATPGLGSWLGGRRTSGSGQMLLAVAGFLLWCCWFTGRLLTQLAEGGIDVEAPQFLLTHHQAFMKWAVISFAVAWLWALVTSVVLLRSIVEPPRRPPPVANPAPPPLPGKTRES